MVIRCANPCESAPPVPIPPEKFVKPVDEPTNAVIIEPNDCERFIAEPRTADVEADPPIALPFQYKVPPLLYNANEVVERAVEEANTSALFSVSPLVNNPPYLLVDVPIPTPPFPFTNNIDAPVDEAMFRIPALLSVEVPTMVNAACRIVEVEVVPTATLSPFTKKSELPEVDAMLNIPANGLVLVPTSVIAANPEVVVDVEPTINLPSFVMLNIERPVEEETLKIFAVPFVVVPTIASVDVPIVVLIVVVPINNCPVPRSLMYSVLLAMNLVA